MTTEEIADLGDRLKKKLPKGVRPKIDEVLKTFDETTLVLSSELVDPIARIPLMSLVNRLESKDLKPVQAMKQLIRQQEWCKLFINAVKEGIDVNGKITPDAIGKLESVYRKEKASGRQVKFSHLLDGIEHFNTTEVKSEPDFNDITASNIIITLMNIVNDSKAEILQTLPEAAPFLDAKDYDKIAVSEIAIGSDWAEKQIRMGRAKRVNVRSYVLRKRKDVKRAIELLKMFQPLLEEAHILVSLMPVLLTMMYGENGNLDKIREDCNNIFNEFSMGAQLERLTISLNEKIGKNRDLEEIEINRAGIEKNLQKIKDALSYQVISYLRRNQVKTIIEDGLFEDAKQIGIDLTGLRTKFGVERAPEEYNDIKMDIIPEFARIVHRYVKTIGNRVSQELGVDYDPNLHTLDTLISTIKKRIESYYSMIPTHISPIFAGVIRNIIVVMEKIIEFIKPLKSSSLILILNNSSKKAEFYGQLKGLYDELEAKYEIYQDFVDIGIKVATADQKIAITICSNDLSPSDHTVAYSELFQKSISKITSMRGMKTLSKEGAEIFQKKITAAQNDMKAFTARYTWDMFNEIVKLGRNGHL